MRRERRLAEYKLTYTSDGVLTGDLTLILVRKR